MDGALVISYGLFSAVLGQPQARVLSVLASFTGEPLKRQANAVLSFTAVSNPGESEPCRERSNGQRLAEPGVRARFALGVSALEMLCIFFATFRTNTRNAFTAPRATLAGALGSRMPLAGLQLCKQLLTTKHLTQQIVYTIEFKWK